jgi:hypothetical protein
MDFSKSFSEEKKHFMFRYTRLRDVSANWVPLTLALSLSRCCSCLSLLMACNTGTCHNECGAKNKLDGTPWKVTSALAFASAFRAVYSRISALRSSALFIFELFLLNKYDNYIFKGLFGPPGHSTASARPTPEAQSQTSRQTLRQGVMSFQLPAKSVWRELCGTILAKSWLPMMKESEHRYSFSLRNSLSWRGFYES